MRWLEFGCNLLMDSGQNLEAEDSEPKLFFLISEKPFQPKNGIIQNKTTQMFFMCQVSHMPGVILSRPFELIWFLLRTHEDSLFLKHLVSTWMFGSS